MSSKATIYLVDDNYAVRDSLTFLLESEDIAVKGFDSAEAFLVADRTTQRSCAIVDMRLPGLSGLDLQAELSSRNFVLPIIFLTGHYDLAVTMHAIHGGAFAFLAKPPRCAELLEIVEAALCESDRLIAQSDRNPSGLARDAAVSEREFATPAADGSSP
jgi:two-component system response regulator FixJ